MQKEAIKKLKDELKAIKKGERYVDAIKKPVTNALISFCKQEQEFAQAIVQSDKKLEDCLKLEQNEQKTELSAEETKKIKQEAEQKAKAEYEKKLKLEVDKAKTDTKQALEVEYKEKIKKVSSSSADESKIAFKFYFNEMKKNLEAFKQTIESVEDAELKAKYKEAYKQYLNLLITEI